MDDATQAPRRRSRWRRRLGIGCLGLLVIGAIAAAALWVTKPWAPVVEVVDPGPGGVRVSADGLLGNYYAADEKAPGVLVLGGSEGGLSTYADLMAQALRSAGYSTLALSYFGGPDQPQAMDALPLETFDEALEHLKSRPKVNPERLAVIGASKGGEATVLLAARHPELKAAVGLVPSSVVWQGMDLQQPWRMNSITSTWSDGGQPVPYLPYSGFPTGDLVTMYSASLEHLGEHQDAIIPIERGRAQVLLVCGEDDTMWPGCEMSRQVQRRAQEHGGPSVTVLAYRDAGHFAGGPPVPTDSEFSSRLADMGGTVEGNAAARADGWPRILQHLQRALRG